MIDCREPTTRGAAFRGEQGSGAGFRKHDFAKGMHACGKRNAAPPGFFRNAAPPGRPGKPAETRKTKEINRKSKKNKGNQCNLKGKERGEREGAPGAPARFARVGAPVLSPLSLFPSDCIDLLCFSSIVC